jgi:methylase of polypeptide subunit release factors
MENILDVGVGSGILLAYLSRLGAKHVWGVDINPDALKAAEHLLREQAPSIPRTLLLGDMWQPLTHNQRFDVVVANLPHFPANVAPHDRPKTWTGGEGRLTINRFIKGLPDRLEDNGVALMTHHDLVGLQATIECAQSSGLNCETLTQWTVFESPDRMSAVSEEVLTAERESFYYVGGYAFIEARILAFTTRASSMPRVT